MALTTVQSGMMDSVAQYYSFKNKFINGAMQFWQRGTSFSAPANLSYTADRWFSIWGTANRTVSRQSGFSGSQYCLRVARNSGTTDNSYSGVVQIIESVNLYDLQGQTVTLSFSARRGANYSSASNALLVTLGSGTVADQGSSVYWSPGWTGITNPINTSVSLGTTEQTFSLQATIPSNCLELALTFQFISTGTAGANDYFEVTNVQLEKGVTATSFDYRPYTTELQLCQRYFEKSYQQSVVPGTAGQNLGGVQFPIITAIPNGYQTGQSVSFMVQKRTAPTIVIYSYNGALNKLTLAGGADQGTNSCQPNLVGDWSFTTINNSGSSIGVTAGALYQFTASAEL